MLLVLRRRLCRAVSDGGSAARTIATSLVQQAVVAVRPSVLRNGRCRQDGSTVSFVLRYWEGGRRLCDDFVVLQQNRLRLTTSDI